MILIIIGIVICVAAYGLYEFTGMSADAAFFLVLGIVVAGIVLFFVISNMIEKAEKKHDKKKLKVFNFLGKSGMTISGVSVVTGIVMFLVGWSTSDGRYGYDIHWSGKRFFLAEATPVFMFLGIFIAVAGVILFLISIACHSDKANKDK